MTPSVTYAWQPIGVQWGRPAKGKNAINVLGFLDTIHNQLSTYTIPKGEYMNSDLFIKYVEHFRAKITDTRPLVLVLDNAPWHKSSKTLAKIQEWQMLDLYVFFLPTYSPHLNSIETLWRKVKHEWLCRRDYFSKKTLTKKLKTIFSTYNKDYKIHFSMDIS